MQTVSMIYLLDTDKGGVQHALSAQAKGITGRGKLAQAGACLHWTRAAKGAAAGIVSYTAAGIATV